MKYDSNTKRDRNTGIIQVRKSNPNLSLKDIGVMFPVNGKPLSPQRVAAIIKQHS